jgi:hypothetical protein
MDSNNNNNNNNENVQNPESNPQLDDNSVNKNSDAAELYAPEVDLPPIAKYRTTGNKTPRLEMDMGSQEDEDEDNDDDDEKEGEGEKDEEESGEEDDESDESEEDAKPPNAFQRCFQCIYDVMKSQIKKAEEFIEKETTDQTGIHKPFFAVVQSKSKSISSSNLNNFSIIQCGRNAKSVCLSRKKALKMLRTEMNQTEDK